MFDYNKIQIDIKFVLGILFFAAGITFAYTDLPCGYVFCEEHNDRLHFASPPNSLQTTLLDRLNKDTSFVFWGNYEASRTLAYLNQNDTATVYDEKISDEDRKLFDSWARPLYNELRDQLHSSTQELRDAYNDSVLGSASYTLVEILYKVKRIYNRETKKWDKQYNRNSTVSKKFLIRSGPFIEPSTQKIHFSFDQTDIDILTGRHPFESRPTRVFFDDGYSAPIDDDILNSLTDPENRNQKFFPHTFTAELQDNKSVIYKERIKEALAAGDRETIRNTMDSLDAFIEQSMDKLYIDPVSGLDCSTKRFMSIYLRTFKDNMECQDSEIYNGINKDYIQVTYTDKNKQSIQALLLDSLKKTFQSGELETSMVSFSSGDRAFWRVLVGASTTENLEERNNLVKANADSIKKTDQQEYIIKNFYRETTLNNFSGQFSFVGGISVPLGKAKKVFSLGETFGGSFNATYKKFDAGVFIRAISSTDITDSTFISGAFINVLIGVKTLSFPRLENRIFLGPSIVATSLQKKVSKKSFKSETSCGFHIGTSFDFYFTEPKIDKPSDMKKIDTGHARIGLRLSTGYENFNTPTLGDNGGNFYLSLGLVIQGYGSRFKKYGE